MIRLPRKGVRRSTRTVVLAIGAMALLPWAAVHQFGMPVAEFLRLLLGAVGALFVVILAAALTLLALVALRRLWERRDQSSS